MLRKIVLGVFTLLMVLSINAQKTSILVFSKTAGYRHKSIEAGQKAIKKLSKENNWEVTFSEDSGLFNSKDLSEFDVLFFLNTTGDILNDEQQKAMKDFLTKGKGFVGNHAASDTEKDWKWYGDLIGAVFRTHPKQQKATIKVNKRFGHKAVEHLRDEETFFDEWYSFKEPMGAHINVLATVDGNSYENKKGSTHPIVWYHNYDGARVFYTGLGHTKESYSDERLLKQLVGGIEWASGKVQVNTLTDKWTSLLKGDPSENWDVFLGVPHKTVKDLPNVNPKSNGIKGEPLGLNNDPKKVFNFIEDKKGNNTVHITGEIYGALTTKQEYENYHLKLKVKWGEKKWEPRLDDLRDSGLLYHCTGPFRRFWNVWMSSQELQIQEGDIGDFYGLGGAKSDIPAIEVEGRNKWEKKVFNLNGDLYTGNTKKSDDVEYEKKNGKWNTVELITHNGTSLHILNGKVVMVLYNSRIKGDNGEYTPLNRGKIQIQCEAAEVYYKDIKIKSIGGIPNKYKKFLKKN